ncbi:MAG: hypothetical protein MI755_05475 [Sphingomonadales bacterium]|nr:hypothetical protein [Sphingomonadales bacterium]
MTVFEMVFGIVLVTTLAGLYSKHLKHKERRAEMAGGGDVAAEEDQSDDVKAARIAELEERIRVLERIVTDKSRRVAEEIDEL